MQWTTKSQIVHAVAVDPMGIFEKVDTPLPAKGPTTPFRSVRPDHMRLVLATILPFFSHRFFEFNLPLRTSGHFA